MANLVDSGVRHEFETGGMREIIDGKGRCDLLPLDVISKILHQDYILENIHNYMYIGDQDCLYMSLKLFLKKREWDAYTAMLELAKHYEDGAQKYAERNWEKGIPLHSFMDSGVRHYLKFLRGDTDEPHDRAFLWNLIGAIWTHEHRPSMIDLPFGKTQPIKDA